MDKQKIELQQIKITPEKLMKVINGEKAGMGIEEAAKLLLFLRELARIVVTKYLEK